MHRLTCYYRKYPKPLVVCGNCGEARPHAAHGLCKNCFEKTRIIVCTRCGETKQRAARGLCHRCYRHVYKDPGIVERMAAREAEDAEKERAFAQQLAEEEAERLQRRCKTCRRLLILSEDATGRFTEFCDAFCYNHHPDRRKARGSTWWQPKVLTKLKARRAEALQAEARQAEARQVEDTAVTV